MYNKTIIRFSFCDILNKQGLGKYYQPQLPTARLIRLTSTLIIPDITKTSSNNCLEARWYNKDMEDSDRLEVQSIPIVQRNILRPKTVDPTGKVDFYCRIIF